jgi:nucleotide-binding universal stress UspA family protein
MKTIVGIDFEGHYESAFRLLARLRFAQNQLELLHADEPYVTYVPSTYMTLEEDASHRDRAMQLLDEAKERAGVLALEVDDQRYVVDPPAKALLEESESQHVDLLAIGARQKSKYGSLFLGSVGRALTIASPASVLVAKGDVEPTGGLTVVVATDHSAYADEAVRLFVRMQPQGIHRLIVVTAVGAPPPASIIDRERAQTTEASRRMVAYLASFGLPAEYRVIEGHPDQVIAATMEETKADLLAMGAQGHGFFERLVLGSVSLRHVVASPHSTLILRPR